MVQNISGGVDAKLKISNYPLKIVLEKIVKGLKVVASYNSNFVKPSPMPDSKSMIVQGAVICDDEHSAINSLQDQTRKDTAKSHSEDEGTTQAEKIQQTKTPANDQESILCSS